MLLVDGKAQVEQLKLAIVAVEHIPTRSAFLAGTAHVLAKSVEGLALFGIALRVVTVGVADVALERRDPIDFVGGLDRHRNHGGLGHVEKR